MDIFSYILDYSHGLVSGLPGLPGWQAAGIRWMMNFGVRKSKEDALKERMKKFDIRESDIDEKFIRSGGKGGQNVNKTSTCVYLKHRPSGVEVKCQDERSQALNRFLARRRLVNKIETLILGKESLERKRIEKIRRQKRRRSRRAKEKMLKFKKIRSEKKEMRSRPRYADE